MNNQDHLKEPSFYALPALSISVMTLAGIIGFCEINRKKAEEFERKNIKFVEIVQVLRPEDNGALRLQARLYKDKNDFIPLATTFCYAPSGTLFNQENKLSEFARCVKQPYIIQTGVVQDRRNYQQIIEQINNK